MLDLWCFVLVNALTNWTYGRCLCLEGDATSDVGSLFAPLLIYFCAFAAFQSQSLLCQEECSYLVQKPHTDGFHAIFYCI